MNDGVVIQAGLDLVFIPTGYKTPTGFLVESIDAQGAVLTSSWGETLYANRPEFVSRDPGRSYKRSNYSKRCAPLMPKVKQCAPASEFMDSFIGYCLANEKFDQLQSNTTLSPSQKDSASQKKYDEVKAIKADLDKLISSNTCLSNLRQEIYETARGKKSIDTSVNQGVRQAIDRYTQLR